MICPHYQKTENPVKAGKTRARSQRYKCNGCQRIYTPNLKQPSYPDEMRQQVVKLYNMNGMNLRRIGHHLGVDHKTVRYWLKAQAACTGTR